MRVCVCAVSTFDRDTANTWLLSSILAFCLDLLLYHSLGICLRSTAQFAALISAGTDGSTISRGVGKLMEQVRWFCVNIYPYNR